MLHPSKIVLDPGHGGRDPGATWKHLTEAEFTLEIASVTHDVLRNIYSSKAFLTRRDDEYVSLEDRCNFANNLEADLFVSIHLNADPDDDTDSQQEASGEEIWYHHAGLPYANIMRSYVDQIVPGAFRGVKRTNSLYVLKNTKMPAVLIECAFIDSLKDMHYLNKRERLVRAGELIAQGIYKSILEVIL